MKNKVYIPTIIFLVAITIVYGIPKPKYQGSKILSQLTVPLAFGDWQGKEDTGKEVKAQDEKYNFISAISFREYKNSNGEVVYFTLLDAGNFHNPKVCMGGSGYTARELGDITVSIVHSPQTTEQSPVHSPQSTEQGPGRGPLTMDRGLKATAVYFTGKEEGILTVYWIMIDKERVDWAKQKIKEFWYSLFNKQKVGLMVRMDIPTNGQALPRAQELAKEFLQAFYPQIPPEQREYIFGK